MIRIAVLGGLDVRDPTRGSLTTLLAQPKRAGLLVYLAVENHSEYASRDALLALFWPEYDESRARAALRQALAFLRRTLGETAILTRGDDGVRVDQSVVACDVRDFRELLRAGRDEEAMALYRGPFLEGVVVDDAPAFEQWTADIRATLAREAADAAARSADRLVREGRMTEAAEHARTAQQLDPFNESHHRRLVTLMDRAGDRSGALREHERFATFLRTELDVAPAPETLALIGTMRARTIVNDLPDPPDQTHRDEPPRPTRRGVVRWWPAVLGTAALVAAAVWLVRSRDEPIVTGAIVGHSPAPTRIAVLPFTQRDGVSTRGALGAMAADWITEGLSRLEGMEVVPATALLATQTALAGEADAAQWQRVAVDVGAGVVVRGDIYRDGRTLHLQAQVLETQTGRLLRPVERVSIADDSVMVGIDQLRTQVVAAMAPLTDTVTHLRRAIAPPTYESYADYVAGLEAFVRGDPRGALVRFERSAAADSAYPMPRIAAVIMRLNLDDADGAQRLISSLESHRGRLGPLEQSTLDMAEGLLAGDLPSAYDAVVRQAKIAPGTIGEYMIGELARKMNRPAEAVSVLRALGPERGELRGWRPYWRELTFALHMLGNHDEELVAAREAAGRYPSDPVIMTYELRALAALGDHVGLSSTLARLDASAASSGQRAAARVMVASEFLAHHSAAAGREADRVVWWFDSVPSAERAADDVRRQETRALLLANRAADARERLAPLIEEAFRANDRPPLSLAVLGLAGNVAAAVGDTANARRWMDSLDTRARQMTRAARGLSWGEATYWRATIAARLADSTNALALLREARREGLGMDPTVHAERAFAVLRDWPPFRAIISP